MKIGLFIVSGLLCSAPLRAAERTSEPTPEADVPFAKQLFGDVPRAISGNPVEASDMPGTGLLGRLLHVPADTGLRLGGMWLADSTILISGGAETGKWSFNSALIVGANLGKCDAILLESIDGRVHLDQFREVAAWGLPVFIDKPLTVSLPEAKEIVKIAAENNTRVTSASAIRFAEAFQLALGAGGEEPVIGGDFHGPMFFVDKCPGYFWYGIHSVEMLFAAMGPGCREVLAVCEEQHDVLVGRWADGRLGVVRGNRAGNHNFGGVIHRTSKSFAFDVSTGKKPYYACLLEKVIPFFLSGAEVVSADEMVEVIGFLDAANRSRTTGQWTAI